MHVSELLSAGALWWEARIIGRNERILDADLWPPSCNCYGLGPGNIPRARFKPTLIRDNTGSR